jgi:hypothetical protein
MRKIITDLSSIDSPIRKLVEIMHQPLVRISPEMEEAFERIYPEFTIECVNSNKRILNVCTTKKHIEISTIYLEILWCFGYVHFKHYNRFVDACINPEKNEMPLITDDETKSDYELLKWITEKALNQNDTSWPDGCPKPILNPPKESDLNVADEFCLGGLACLIHHELAHIQLKHTTSSNIEIENDADIGSWEWILPAGFDVTSPAGRKRLLMITHAYLIPVVLDIHRGEFPSNTHPASYDRLAYILDRIDTERDYMSHSYAHAVIHLHLSNSCSKIPMYKQIVHETVRDAFNFQIDHLAQYEAARRAQPVVARQ